MAQSKRRSAVEALCNQASGIVLSLLVWRFVICPWKNIVHDPIDNIQVTATFFCVSLLRSFVWRRIFNRGDN